jgi:hypothetical protein
MLSIRLNLIMNKKKKKKKSCLHIFCAFLMQTKMCIFNIIFSL